MKKIILTLAVIAFTAALPASAWVERLETFGVGSSSCEEWTNNRMNGGWGQKAQWAIGYLSAIQAAGEIDLAVGGVFNVELLTSLLDLNCIENPRWTLDRAVKQHIVERGIKEPKTSSNLDL